MWFLRVLHALPWAKNALWTRPCLSTCLSSISAAPYELVNPYGFPKRRSEPTGVELQGFLRPLRASTSDFAPEGHFPPRPLLPSASLTLGLFPQYLLPVTLRPYGPSLAGLETPGLLPPQITQASKKIGTAPKGLGHPRSRPLRGLRPLGTLQVMPLQLIPACLSSPVAL
jgi:hypothetical protein